MIEGCCVRSFVTSSARCALLIVWSFCFKTFNMENSASTTPGLARRMFSNWLCFPNDPANNKVEEKQENSRKRILMQCVRLFLIFFSLYFFVCSLDLLANSFRLIAGKTTGSLTRSWVLSNPIAALMVGILLTVLVQSSSTSTSIIITMVAAEMLSTTQAAYMVMGANIGTSVTNTLVSLGQVGSRRQFRRAFAGATVHDVFNWLSVLVLLPLEVTTHYLASLTNAIENAMNIQQYKAAKQDLLKVITKPLTELVIQIDKKIIHDPKKILTADTLMMYCCKKAPATEMNMTNPNETVPAPPCLEKCKFMFVDVVGKWPDYAVGIILLVISLALLVICLLFLVRTLNALLQTSVSNSLKKFVNSNKLGCFTDYLAILIGAILTILVQSSSVFTSALTPLVGSGFIELERMYPLSLGSNIGTTVTGILAALASDSQTLKESMQTALTHLFFNLSGILIWFPVPFMRAVPLAIAKRLGKTTSRYRWFALVYIVWMFFLFPLLVFGLSLVAWWLPVIFVVLIVVVLLFVAIVNAIQHRRPQVLPAKMRTWKWLPLPLRSLEPYDRLVSKLMCTCCAKCQNDDDDEESEDEIVAKEDPEAGKGCDWSVEGPKETRL